MGLFEERAATPEGRARMEELHRLTLLYEIAFWEMARNGEGWPGTDHHMAGPASGPAWNPDRTRAARSAWAEVARKVGEGDDR